MFLTLAFLFFVGSVTGWVLELFFRRFISSANPDRKWINPGFCTGPYLPLYGFGLCLLYLVASLDQKHFLSNPVWNKAVLVLFMAVCMTALEYLAGLLSLKLTKVRLWDYSDQWGNINGIICPLFSLFWAILGALYYFLIHPHICVAVNWFQNNLAFSFVIGMFFGVFIIDVIHSAQLVAKLRRYAQDNDVVIRYEHLKAQIRRSAEKAHFFFPFRSEKPLHEHLQALAANLEEWKEQAKKYKKQK